MDKYTKFVLTVIAVGIIWLNYYFFKDEIISPAHAVESHTHNSYDIYGLEDHSHSHTHNANEIYGLLDEDHDRNLSTRDIRGFDSSVRHVVNSYCSVNYGIMSC